MQQPSFAMAMPPGEDWYQHTQMQDQRPATQQEHEEQTQHKVQPNITSARAALQTSSASAAVGQQQRQAFDMENGS